MNDLNTSNQTMTMFKIPNNLEVEMMMLSFIYQGNFKEMIEREKRYSNGKFRVLDVTFEKLATDAQSEGYDPDKVKVVKILAHSNAKMNLVFLEPELLKKCSPAILKIIVFLCTNIFAHLSCNRKNPLNNPLMQFSSQDLVDLGVYKNLDAATTEVKIALKILGSIRFVKPVHAGQAVTLGELEQAPVLFSKVKVKRKFFDIDLNPAFDWKMFQKPFTWVPAAIFTLSKYASRMMWYICFLARQNEDKILENGEFSIGLNTVVLRLGIRYPHQTHSPKRDIWDIIQRMTQEINESVECLGIHLRLEAILNCAMEETLKSGKIVVEIMHPYIENIAKLHLTKQEKQKLVEVWKTANMNRKNESKTKASVSGVSEEKQSLKKDA